MQTAETITSVVATKSPARVETTSSRIATIDWMRGLSSTLGS